MKTVRILALFAFATVMCYSCTDNNYNDIEDQIELQNPSEEEGDDEKGVPGSE